MISLETSLWIVGLIALYALVRWIRSRPLPPDPWDNVSFNHEHDDVIDVKASEVPVCTNCLEPIENPRQHYCPKCGNVTGEYTRYVPFVNIQFECSIFVTMWKNVKSEESSLLKKALCSLFILFTAPISLPVLLVAFFCAFFLKKKE